MTQSISCFSPCYQTNKQQTTCSIVSRITLFVLGCLALSFGAAVMAGAFPVMGSMIGLSSIVFGILLIGIGTTIRFCHKRSNAQNLRIIPLETPLQQIVDSSQNSSQSSFQEVLQDPINEIESISVQDNSVIPISEKSTKKQVRFKVPAEEDAKNIEIEKIQPLSSEQKAKISAELYAIRARLMEIVKEIDNHSIRQNNIDEDEIVKLEQEFQQLIEKFNYVKNWVEKLTENQEKEQFKNITSDLNVTSNLIAITRKSFDKNKKAKQEIHPKLITENHLPIANSAPTQKDINIEFATIRRELLALIREVDQLLKINDSNVIKEKLAVCKNKFEELSLNFSHLSKVVQSNSDDITNVQRLFKLADNSFKSVQIH